MNTIASIIVCYGLFIFIGGLMGYIKAKSRASLVTGGLSGLLIIISGIFTFLGYRIGPIAASLLTLSLTLFFGYKLNAAYKSKTSIVRPLIIVIFSLVVLASLWCLACPYCQTRP